MAGRPFADLVAIGRVVKPQGRKGEVLVEPLSDRPDRFPVPARRLRPRSRRRVARGHGCESCWPHKGRFVLKLEGVDSIDEAEGYRGLELRIGEEELAVLPSGSYYHHQLKGLRVEDTGGRSLGVAADLMETGGESPVLVVRGAGGELLIPLAEALRPPRRPGGRTHGGGRPGDGRC